MRSASNGLATTLLLLVPLVAVPFAAAIGLPQLSTTTAAATTDDPDVQPVERASAGDSRPLAAEQPVAGAQPSADDLFAPLDGAAAAPQETAYEEPVSADAFARDRRARVRSRLAALAAADQEQVPANASSGSHNADPIVRDDAFADTRAAARVSPGPEPAIATERGARVAPDPFPRRGEPSDNSQSPEGNLPAGSELTWQRAVQRMQELGIEDFALSPGTTDQGFHFRCQLSDMGDPGVIHRFEAEAADPLTAVAAAIEQVEGWLEQTASADSPLEGRLARLAPELERSVR